MRDHPSPRRSAGAWRTLLAATIWASPGFSAAALSLPALLSDGVVFQAGNPIRLWGTAAPGETVTIAWGALRGTAPANGSGRWRIDLPASDKAPGDTILVSAEAGEQLRINNAAIGQVWICGGQSNMALPLRRTDEAKLAGQPLPAPASVRLYRAPLPGTQRATQGRWMLDSPSAASAFSAVCYLTGRMLAMHAKGPVGLIDTSVGATDIQAWLPPGSAGGVPTATTTRPVPRRHSMAAPGDAFEAMIRPITPFSAQGILWYQGEADARKPDGYASVFTSAIKLWRESFEQPDLPVIYMQLPAFDGSPFRNGWNEIRVQQARAEGMLPGVRMASSDGIIATEIHPTKKSEVARRLFTRATGVRP